MEMLAEQFIACWIFPVHFQGPKPSGYPDGFPNGEGEGYERKILMKMKNKLDP